MSELLGRAADAKKWNEKAAARHALIDKYFWDQEKGLYFDYDFTTQTRSTYKYATTFYPLWAGLASKEQAQAVMRSLPFFEQPGGIVMSGRESQAQWDYPYGWAPIQLLAIEGMRRYGYDADYAEALFNRGVALQKSSSGSTRRWRATTTRSSSGRITPRRSTIVASRCRN